MLWKGKDKRVIDNFFRLRLLLKHILIICAAESVIANITSEPICITLRWLVYSLIIGKKVATIQSINIVVERAIVSLWEIVDYRLSNDVVRLHHSLQVQTRWSKILNFFEVQKRSLSQVRIGKHMRIYF